MIVVSTEFAKRCLITIFLDDMLQIMVCNLAFFMGIPFIVDVATFW
jgi:hypothetical protein